MSQNTNQEKHQEKKLWGLFFFSFVAIFDLRNYFLNLLWERPQGKGQEERLTSLSFKLFWHRHFVTHKCTFTAINWSNSNTLLSVFMPLPSFWYLPCPDCQAQGHEKEEGGGKDAYSVFESKCVCALTHGSPVYVQMCAACHFHSLVNRKLSGHTSARVLITTVPVALPSALIADLETV